MSRELVFTRKSSPQEKIQLFVEKYKLEQSYDDKYESIYISDHIILSITKRIIWILLTDKISSNIEKEINNYFKDKKTYYYGKFNRKNNKYREHTKK